VCVYVSRCCNIMEMEDLGAPPPSPCKLFVGNLPADVQAEELRAFFQEYGAIADVHLMSAARSRLGNACAFVVFVSGEQAQKAIQACHHKLKLRPDMEPLTVSVARQGRAAPLASGPSGHHVTSVGALGTSTASSAVPGHSAAHVPGGVYGAVPGAVQQQQHYGTSLVPHAAVAAPFAYPQYVQYLQYPTQYQPHLVPQAVQTASPPPSASTATLGSPGTAVSGGAVGGTPGALSSTAAVGSPCGQYGQLVGLTPGVSVGGYPGCGVPVATPPAAGTDPLGGQHYSLAAGTAPAAGTPVAHMQPGMGGGAYPAAASPTAAGLPGSAHQQLPMQQYLQSQPQDPQQLQLQQQLQQQPQEQGYLQPQMQPQLNSQTQPQLQPQPQQQQQQQQEQQQQPPQQPQQPDLSPQLQQQPQLQLQQQVPAPGDESAGGALILPGTATGATVTPQVGSSGSSPAPGLVVPEPTKSSLAPNACKVLVGNMPLDILSQTIEMVFATYGRVLSVQMLPPPPGASSASAVVEYDGVQSAQTSVVTLHQRYEIREGFGNVSVQALDGTFGSACGMPGTTAGGCTSAAAGAAMAGPGQYRYAPY